MNAHKTYRRRPGSHLNVQFTFCVQKVRFLLLGQLIRIFSKSSYSEVFSGKGVLKIYSKFIGEHPSRSVISWVFSSKFALYSQNIFSQEHLWRAVSVFLQLCLQRDALQSNYPLVELTNNLITPTYFQPQNVFS